jgi:hypothetical protein
MANEYLRRTTTSTGNKKVFTYSFWMKGTDITKSDQSKPFYNYDGGSGLFQLFVERSSNTNPGYWVLYGGSVDIRWIGKRDDPSSWYHIVLSVDTTKTQSVDRAILHINGVRMDVVGSQLGSPGTPGYPTLNSDQYHGFNYINGIASNSRYQLTDYYFVDGQALTPDVFGFYKQGKGYISAGSTQSTDFRSGQWVPKTPRVIKTEINRRGGFGVNGFYLPMNDSKNFGADFHGEPNSIITLNEKLPQPRVGVASTAAVGLGFTDVLRADPYAANLVLAVPGVIGGQGSGYGDYSANIKGSGSNKTVTANGNAGVALTASYYGSALSFDGSGDYLSIPDSSDFTLGSENFTIECWFNPNAYGSFPSIVHQYGSGTNRSFFFSLNGSSSPLLKFYLYYNSASSVTEVTGVSVPLNQWTHVVAERQNNILSLYQNGVVTGIATNITYTVTDSSELITIGDVTGGNYPLNGYIQDLRVYKGVAKYKGGFDVPRPYTPVGIATWRQVPDTTANNFATLNKLFNSASGNVVLADGNLTYTGSQTPSYGLSQSTIGVSTSKWYWEFRIGSTVPNLGIGVMRPGISTSSAVTNPENSFITGVDGGIAFYHGIANRVYYWTGSAQTFVSYTLPACTTGDIVSIALDLTGGNNSKIYFAKNGTWGESGDPATGTNPVGLALSGTYAPAVSIGAAGASTGYFNFGQNPTFSGNTTAGTFTDSNGKGLFKYQPPSDFLSLCEDNLPTPTISDPGKYFKTVLYTGTNSSRDVVGVGFTPDLVWIKRRNAANSHGLYDSVRGAGYELQSASTSAEKIPTTPDGFLSFNMDGFSLGPNNNEGNADINFVSGGQYVAWCWRAGAGTTSTNTNGSITSVVSVNQDAGFSIVSWTGNGSSTATVGHGLGKTPAFLISKARSGTNEWWVVHKSGNGNLQLNATLALITSGGTNGAMGFPSTLTNNTFTFTAGSSSVNNVNASGTTYVTYCWAEIEGFSKAFSYTGNGSADGPFVFLNLKPAFVIIKRTDISGENWLMYDASRNSVNEVNLKLAANSSIIENDATIGTSSQNTLDFLSNGFKLRTTNTGTNASGGTYIGMAFAESPFVYSNSK